MNVVSSSNWRELGTSFLNLGVPWYYTDPSCALLEKSTGIIQLSPEGDVNSGTNQLDKIKKETFCNKKCHLVRVCLVFNWQCFGNHFLWFGCHFSRKMFFYRPVNKPNFVFFLVFVGAAASLTATISSVHVSKLSRNEKPFWIPSQNNGFSEIWEPIRARENSYPLTWWILITDSPTTNRYLSWPKRVCCCWTRFTISLLFVFLHREPLEEWEGWWWVSKCVVPTIVLYSAVLNCYMILLLKNCSAYLRVGRRVSGRIIPLAS